jgi:hypothetical protein
LAVTKSNSKASEVLTEDKVVTSTMVEETREEDNVEEDDEEGI